MSSTQNQQRVLVLGATGMLGSALFSQLSKFGDDYSIYGTFRNSACLPQQNHGTNLIELKDVFDTEALRQILKDNNINVVINAIGLIKQIGGTLKKADFIKVNAWLPHYLMALCDEVDARFIEVSTDCVFSGEKGNYSEENTADAKDIYGLTKLMGEVTNNPNALTIRTSIIGHESGRAASLIDWFLSTSGEVKGYSKAIFSGLPTVYLAKVIGELILPNKNLSGLYHISVDPIDKFSLLGLVAKAYNHKVELIPDDQLVIDRSLDSTRFRLETGFRPEKWPELINMMKTERTVWIKNEH